MAEPFSTAAASIALIANLKSLYDYIKEAKEGIGTVHNDIKLLETELETLYDLCKDIEQQRVRHQKQSSLDEEQRRQWDGLSKPLATMSAAIQDFEVKLHKVYGEDPKRRARKESFKKWYRFKEVEPALNNLRSTISSSTDKIAVWLHSIGINKLCVFRTSWMVDFRVLTQTQGLCMP